MNDSESFAKLVRLLNLNSKREVITYCKALMIKSEDFFALILSAEEGLIPYCHRIYHREFVPKHLELSNHELGPIETDESGRMTGHSRKFIRKATQIFRDRRLLVGHMFYTSDLGIWHFFYFDQRDQAVISNHWKHGPHIHFINWLWPNNTANDVWKQFTDGNPDMRGSLHIRYIDDRDD